MLSASNSSAPSPPLIFVQCSSTQLIFSAGSCGRDDRSNGRRPASKASSAIRAERFDDRVAPKVAIASTSVPPAVASDEIVTQSAMRRGYPADRIASMDELVDHHRGACDGFATVADAIPADGWSAPTPCTEWDARAVVEHVIGFHEFLLLRPMGVRANRPRDDEAARWHATSAALFAALEADGAIDRTTELPGGGTSSPRTMLAALTTDVLIHTWDLARSAAIDVALDPELCARALRTPPTPSPGMIEPAVPVPDDAGTQARLVAAYGRDPFWTPP